MRRPRARRAIVFAAAAGIECWDSDATEMARGDCDYDHNIHTAYSKVDLIRISLATTGVPQAAWHVDICTLLKTSV